MQECSLLDAFITCFELLLQEAGFHIKGQAKTLDIMRKYRLCLAPLRFGAGLKGKIVDSWQNGLPVVTTVIGAEGMTGPFRVKQDNI